MGRVEIGEDQELERQRERRREGQCDGDGHGARTPSTILPNPGNSHARAICWISLETPPPDSFRNETGCFAVKQACRAEGRGVVAEAPAERPSRSEQDQPRPFLGWPRTVRKLIQCSGRSAIVAQQ